MAAGKVFPKSWDDFQAMHKAGINAEKISERWVICGDNPDCISQKFYNGGYGTVYFDPVHDVYHSFKTCTKEIGRPRDKSDSRTRLYELEKSDFYAEQENQVAAQKSCFINAKELGFLVPDHQIVTFTACLDDSDKFFTKTWHENFDRNELHVQGVVTTTRKIHGMSLYEVHRDKKMCENKKRRVLQEGLCQAIMAGSIMQDWDRNFGNIIVTDVNEENPKSFYHFDFEHTLTRPIGKTVRDLLADFGSAMESRNMAHLKNRFIETAEKIGKNPGAISAVDQSVYQARIQTALEGIERHFCCSAA